MAVISVTETFPDRAADGQSDKFRIISDADRAYIVQFDTISGSEAQALTANDGTTSIPNYGDGHPTDSTMRVRNKRAHPRSGTQYVWDVTVQYSTLAPNVAQSTNPLLQVPQVIRLGTTEISRAVQKWYPAGPPNTPAVAAVNSAGDPFDPPPEEVASIPTIIIRRNESSFSVQRLVKYCNALNQDIFWGYAPYHVKISRLEYTQKYEANLYFYEVEYEFQIGPEPDGWAWKPLDQGSRQLVNTPTGLELMEIRDKANHAAGVVPLDGFGYRLAHGATPVFLGPFYQFQIANFNANGNDQGLRLDPPSASSVPFP